MILEPIFFTECFKKEFTKRRNTSCDLPWTHHFTDRCTSSTKECTDEELKVQYNQEFGLVPKILLDKDSVCMGDNDIFHLGS